jgi:transcriptional regulator with XRE-family HTH domain
MSIMIDAVAPYASLSINARIAKCVRALRMERGLSLDALAKKSGVSRSMISLVERGESSPTATVLERIATGLGVPLAIVFNDPCAAAKPLSRPNERESWQDPQSGYVRCNISPPNFPSPIQIVDIVLPAGAGVAYENGVCSTSVHQQIWVQKGSIEVTVGPVTHRLAGGDCLAMQLNEPTAFHNPTRKPAHYFVVVATEHSRGPRK